MRSTSPSLRIVSCVLTAALAAAPTHSALAAGAAGAVGMQEPVEEEADADSGEPAAEEAEDAEEAPGDGEEPAQGEEAAADSEDGVEGDEGESEDADEDSSDSEDTGAEEAPAEEGPAEEAPAEEAPAEEAPAEQPPAPELAPNPEDDRPAEPRVAGKPRKGTGLMIAGGTVLGLGIASTVTFGLMTRNCSYDGPLQCKLQGQDDFLIPLGASVTLLGAMMLAVGVGYRVQYKKWERWTPGQDDKKKRRRRAETAFVPALGPNGAGMSFVGRF